MADANDKAGLSLHDLADTVLRAEYWKAVEAIVEAKGQDIGKGAVLDSIRKEALAQVEACGWLDDDDRALQCLRYSINRDRIRRLSANIDFIKLAQITMAADVVDACDRRGLT